MQIKSEHKISKQLLPYIFQNSQQNILFKSNIANINRFQQLFDEIRHLRTLERMCKVYTNEERENVFAKYIKVIDELEDLMDKFQAFASRINPIKNVIRIDKQVVDLAQWRQAIMLVSYQGQLLTESIEQKLKLILKAFDLNLRLPFVNWSRWSQKCTDQTFYKKGLCGCFS